MARDEVWYAYGIVREGFDPARAPAGLEDAPVTLVPGGRVSALASRLPAAAYAPDQIERSSGDVGWLSPRAMAHDRVLTWAQDHGGVIPLPMFSLWRTDSVLAKSLTTRARSLAGIFKRVSDADEFGLRVYRRDDVVLATIHEHDATMAKLRAAAQQAPPGQRYLLERKYADQGKQAARAASQRMAKDIFSALEKISRDAIARPLAPAQRANTASDATIVLNGAFLVDRRRGDEFREAVGALVREHQPRGLSFDFSGPWPPYNFVGDVGTASSSRVRRTRRGRKK